MASSYEPWENLANAIVLAAVDDYRKAVKILRKDPENRLAEEKIKSVERFFRSSWYEMLTNLDGEYLIEKLREEADNETEVKRRGKGKR